LRGHPGYGMGPSPRDGAPLDFAQATPDPVRFTDPEGVTEALLAYGASSAHGLGLPLAGGPRFFAFEVRRREKNGRRLAAAGGPRLPALRCVQRRHFVTSIQKVLLSREV